MQGTENFILALVLTGTYLRRAGCMGAVSSQQPALFICWITNQLSIFQLSHLIPADNNQAQRSQMHGRVSPPGTQDWPATADRAVSAVSHAVVKQSKAK